MQPGDTFAHYEILGPIGRGGMGEVFRARDTRLDREVAIKVLPPDLATDPERLARFRREAKVLASLNHTNIATIHGLEEESDRICLAMELAPGETLQAGIDRGPLPLDEVLAIATQIAAGLEEAHAKGIVHRDLKPANVKLGPQGEVKILDFGLARAYQGDTEDAADPDTSPTLTAAMTQTGVILGTAAYMSPEQARGQEVDARSDIWSFGVILWELLTGRRLFAGETVTDTLAMVLRNDPDWDALPPDLPPSLRRLLQRCLQRHKRQRLHHMADARIVLEEIAQDGTSAHEPVNASSIHGRAPARRGAGAGWLVAALLAVTTGLLGWRALTREPAPAPGPIRMDLTLPADTWMSGNAQMFAMSPQGDAFVISLKTDAGTQLFLRAMDDPALVPIEGTEMAHSPFFSADGRWLGFTRDPSMFKVALDGGSPTELCEASWGGGAWLDDGRIVYTPTYSSGLFILPADGDDPRPLTSPDPEHNELGHWWPQVLPGNAWVIYTGYSSPLDRARIMAVSLESGERRVLVEGGCYGRWAPTGHLLYVRDGKLLAAPFDPVKVAVTGGAVAVLEDIFLNDGEAWSPLGFGADGTLVYAPDSVINAPGRLAWLDRGGALTFLDMPARRYSWPRLSPDGRRIAVSVTENHNTDIWIQDLQRGTFSRFTFVPSSDRSPLWTPDGRSVIYNVEEPQYAIYRRPADGSADTRLLLREPEDTVPTSVSPDGRWLVYTKGTTDTQNDLWLLPLDEPGEPRLLLQTDFVERHGVVSPDGRWLAYQSNESGRDEIYVMSFPDGGARTQISLDGGAIPFWAPEGDALFFRRGTELWTADIDTEQSEVLDLRVGRPHLVFNDLAASFDAGEYTPSLTPDGERFLVVHTPDESQPRTLRVVVNWFSELTAR